MEFLKNVNLDKIRNAAEDVINQAKPKTEVEARVYEALSHKNWGSSSTLMNEIARDTFDYERYSVVCKIMWESIENQRPAAWRVVFKGLTLLEHLIKNGSEKCVDEGRNRSHLLRSLNNFNYYEGTVDRGVGVREKSKQIVELLSDNERIREERSKAKALREKFGSIGGGISSSGGGTSYAGYGNDDTDSGNRYNGSSGYGNSGIGSSGGYSDSAVGSDSGYGNSSFGGSENYSGRYSDTKDTDADVGTSSPTFATLPSEKKEKKKSKKSKKKKEKSLKSPEKTAEAPTDLLAFDDPAPAPAADKFDAFQGPAKSADSFDAFKGPTGTATTAASSNASFDAFGSSDTKTDAFDAFASAPMPSTSQPSFDAFGASSSSTPVMTTTSNVNTVNDMFGNMNVGMQGQFPSSNNVMGGNTTLNQQESNDDDFGDFEDADKKTSTGGGDPLSNLISLDGLSKNKSKEDKLNQPISFNNATQSQANMSNGTGMNSAASQSLAFDGVDGLNKVSPTNVSSQPSSTNRPVMGSGGTNLDMFAGNQGNSMGMTNNMQQGMGNMMNNMNGGGMGMMNGNNGSAMGMMNGNNGSAMGMMNGSGGMSMMNNNSGNMGGMNMMGMGSGMQKQNGNMMGGMGMQQNGNMMNGGMGMQGNNMMASSNNNGMGAFDQTSGTMGGQSMGGSGNMMGGQQMGGWQ